MCDEKSTMAKITYLFNSQDWSLSKQQFCLGIYWLNRHKYPVTHLQQHPHNFSLEYTLHYTVE